MLFYGRMHEHDAEFTHSQRQVANYIEEHMEDIAFCTLDTLAVRINVSTTTIIRFARVLGYAGFSDMQNDVKLEIQNKASLPERLDRVMSSSGNDLLQNSFAMDMENIRQTLACQKSSDLETCVELVKNAGKIYVLGMRSSFSLAHYMASRLGEIKKNVRFIQSTGMVYPEEIVGAEPGDVCIAYVFPRYSKTAVNILAWMRSRGVKVVLFTSMNDLPIRHYGDVCFNCAIKSVACKNSLTAPMCLTNYLVAEFSRSNYEEAHEVLSRTEEILSAGFYLGI
ncbi:MAG: MurR/RpiR family transcriptional regulator [Oscillospiraceae bacterium]|nr:MurR/RpiR family transcriptional regulator [Oscillospiraceae bacterium]